MLVDRTHALMSKDEFDDLAEHSLSIPIGPLVVGQQWRRCVTSDGAHVWFLGEVVERLSPTTVNVLWREIILT